MTDNYQSMIVSQRQQKEEYFATNPHSPIAPNQRGEDFPGLAHFPPDESYRFELPLAEHEEKEQITVSTSADGEQEYFRWGEFRFSINDTECSLQAFKSAPDEPRLWVPFRDETNGDETYGAGRYIDLESDHHQTDTGTWILDFNQAYNPTCAYNEAYECPLIPMENWLDCRIEAGEKDYPGEPATIEEQGHHRH